MRSVVCLLSLLLFATSANAWNKPGHMIVAAIAYDDLKAHHPDVLAKVLDILRHHPQADKLQKIDEAVPAEDRDRYMMMIAARWPDDIRDDKTYTHAPWHYIDFPMVFPADRGKVQPDPPDKENALTAIDAEGKQFRNSTDPARRALALCWIEHLTGDLHQPLHCTSLYSVQFPKGDRGGNLQAIKVESERGTVELHSLWDGLLTSSERYQTCAKIAVELEKRPEFARAKLAGVNDPKPLDWAWESYTAAVHSAYLDGAIKSTLYKRGAVDPNAPALPEGYPQQAKAVAEQRIILAGYRLADQLVMGLTGERVSKSSGADAGPPPDPTPPGRQEFTGPRGGHYHFDENGKKVYDKK